MPSSCLTYCRIEVIPLHFNGFAYGENRETEDGEGDLCTLYVSRCFMVDLEDPTYVDDPSSRRQLSDPALCVELVGTRFLRRMVRIIVVSTVRSYG